MPHAVIDVARWCRTSLPTVAGFLRRAVAPPVAAALSVATLGVAAGAAEVVALHSHMQIGDGQAPHADRSQGPHRTAAGDLHALAWLPPAAGCRHLTGLIRVTRNSDPRVVAAQTRSQPVGRRGVMLWKDVLHGFIDHPLDRCRTAEGRPTPYDGVWLQRGPAQVRAGLERFFGAFKAARGELDVLVLDYEAGYHWNRVRHFGAPWRTAVQADPRFPALAEELGFHDLGRIRWGNDEARQWDSVMRARVDRALEAAVFTPARKYFPHVAASNYGSYALKRQEATPNWAGLREYYETPGFGTHDSRQFYTWVPRTRPVRLDAGHTLKNAAFTGLLLDVNRLRAMKRSTRKPIHPWIAAFSWMETEDPGRKPAVSNTPYYDELVYHLALHGIETYIYWNVRVWEEGQNPVHFSKPSDDRRLDHLLAELNERLRGRRRAVLDPSPVDWQAPVIATGMRVDDRVVWRLTFRENVERIRVVVDGEPVEVRREADRAGVWLEHRGDQRLSVP